MRPTKGRRPKTNETAFNFELARQLRARHPGWREAETELDEIAAEQTGALNGTVARRRLDIVTGADMSDMTLPTQLKVSKKHHNSSPRSVR